jgi:hypothetical protein
VEVIDGEELWQIRSVKIAKWEKRNPNMGGHEKKQKWGSWPRG